VKNAVADANFGLVVIKQHVGTNGVIWLSLSLENMVPIWANKMHFFWSHDAHSIFFGRPLVFPGRRHSSLSRRLTSVHRKLDGRSLVVVKSLGPSDHGSLIHLVTIVSAERSG
jgi:hypothetical protein